MTTPDRDVDPVTLEVLRNATAAVCEEMNATLVRTGYSPNITERRDCSCALFDSEGSLIAQAENMPVHLGAMPYSVAAALDRFPPDTLEPGDVLALNDPYHGGAHLPDVTLVTPVFHESGDSTDSAAIVAYVANRAHHADIGGARAGSVGADSTEIYQEGLRIPPVKLRAGGESNEAIVDVLLANVRTPDERRGDLRAQEAANETGRRRFSELIDRYGRMELEETLAAIADYSERRMRSELAALPDGTYTFEDVLDDDGRGNEDLPIRVELTVDADSITVDFSGSAPQTEGPVNAVYAVTASATYYAIRCVTDPDIPPNAGCYRPISIHTPSGSIVDPDPPAAVVGGNLETSQRITDVVLGAIAQRDPERVVAGCQGTMNNLTIGGIDPRDDSPYSFYETQAGGFGGRDGKDGMDGVHVHMTNTLNTPIEVLETAYPLRVRRYELRPNSGGDGEFRGGLGLRRDIEIRGDATVSLLTDRRRHPPYGLAGGEPGETGEDRLFDPEEIPAGGNPNSVEPTSNAEQLGERLPGKCVRTVPAGTVISLRTPGGGGYGEPADRDPERRALDRRQEKVTAKTSDADSSNTDTDSNDR